MEFTIMPTLMHGLFMEAFQLTRTQLVQDAGETQRAAFFADLDAGLATVQKGDFTALTMDTNCSVGVRSTCSTEDDAARSVCGRHGDPRVNSAGDFLKSWLMDRCMHATSTHFRPPSSRVKDGVGTWKHVRNHRTHQNDHIFVKRALLPRVASCRNAAPLCHGDHLAVRAQFRVRVRLQKKKKSFIDYMKETCHNLLRAHVPSHNPFFEAQFLREVRAQPRTHADFFGPGKTCERLCSAMQWGSFQSLPKRQRPSPEWCEKWKHALGPLVAHRNVLMKIG
jgi:hypothetical protein